VALRKPSDVLKISKASITRKPIAWLSLEYVDTQVMSFTARSQIIVFLALSPLNTHKFQQIVSIFRYIWFARGNGSISAVYVQVFKARPIRLFLGKVYDRVIFGFGQKPNLRPVSLAQIPKKFPHHPRSLG
jgi:hypothetical protein